jgi:bifunctional non-homologous end joining protein LigD
VTTAVLPELVAPMLATLGVTPVAAGWGYEFKWDGVRAITYIDRSGARVLSRNDRDVTGTYPELRELVRLLGRHQVVLDGEIVALDSAGRPSFAQLQRRMHVHEPAPSLVAAVPVAYYVFDVLHLDDTPTMPWPYTRRRELLASLRLAGDAVCIPENFVDRDPAEVTAAAAGRGLEGIIAKRLGSPYRPGRRSADWIKTPFSRTQEVIIIGYKPGDGRRAGTIGSLVLAVTEPDGTLSFAGGVGTGFTEAMLRQLQQQLSSRTRRTSPVPGIPREHARGVRWVDPVLVGEVAFRNWTPDGRMRHPSWRGLRPDRDPGDVRRSALPHAVAPASASVEGSMQTPDGRWHVDVMRRADSRWYRVRHLDNEFDWLDLPDVERILTQAGTDLSQLVPTDTATTDPAVPA